MKAAGDNDQPALLGRTPWAAQYPRAVDWLLDSVPRNVSSMVAFLDRPDEACSDRFNRLLQLLPNDFSFCMEFRIGNGHHRCHRIDCCHLDLARFKLLDDDIAWQHGSHLVLQLKRFVGEVGVAGSQDVVGAEAYANFGLERRRDVDIGDDPKTFALQSFGNAGDGLVESERKDFADVVGHGSLLSPMGEPVT